MCLTARNLRAAERQGRGAPGERAREGVTVLTGGSLCRQSRGREWERSP